MLIIVDVDGTIADMGEREAAAGPEPSRLDKPAYRKWLRAIQDEERLAADSPVPLMRQLLTELEDKGNTIVYLTAREEKYRDVTERWLFETHEFPNGQVFMRASDDWRSGEAMKGDKLADIKRFYGEDDILVLDDDPTGKCSRVYRELGCVHLKAMWNR
jgi:hypothetical protein